MQSQMQPIVNDAAEMPCLFFRERRQSQRRRMHGGATMLIREAGAADVRGRIGSIQLLNHSATGLAGLCREPVVIGAHVSVFTTAPEGGHGCDLHGTVVRCEPRGRNNQVAIRLQSHLAA